MAIAIKKELKPRMLAAKSAVHSGVNSLAKKFLTRPIKIILAGMEKTPAKPAAHNGTFLSQRGVKKPMAKNRAIAPKSISPIICHQPVKHLRDQKNQLVAKAVKYPP